MRIREIPEKSGEDTLKRLSMAVLGVLRMFLLIALAFPVWHLIKLCPFVLASSA